MTAWTKIALALLVVAVLGIVAGTIWIAAGVREETVVAHPYEEGLRHHSEHAASTPCDLAGGPCTQPLEGGGEVTLEMAPRPIRTMAELDVRVDVRPPHPDPLPRSAGAREEQPSIAFSMAGMEMGRNEVRLTAAGPSRYRGTAVLVRCPSGRRDWIAEVSVAQAGAAPRTARFHFTVAP